MWPSPQGWWVKERGEVRDWGQAHWSASFFQRHPTTRSNMLQDIRKCGKMTRRWDVVGWKDCAHLALHHPWSLVISGRKARRTMRRERGSSRSLYEKEESWTREEAQRAFDSRQHMLECWQGEENVEYASRSGIHRTSSNLVDEANLPGFPDPGHRVHLLVDRNRWNLLSSILWEGLHHNFTHPCPLNSSWNINLYKNLPTLWPWILTPYFFSLKVDLFGFLNV